MSEDARLDRAEKDIARLFDRTDKQRDALDALRRDLREDLRATEARLDRRITESHTEVVREIANLDIHLTKQDDLIAAAARRDSDLIRARIDWPSWRKTAVGIGATVTAWLIARFGFHIHSL